MKKRILASLMAVCLIAGLLPTAALAAEPGTEQTALVAPGPEQESTGDPAGPRQEPIPPVPEDAVPQPEEDTKGTEADPYSREDFSKMTRAEYIAAQKRLGGTMYVDIDNYNYEKDGVLGNGTADNSDKDETKLNYYGAPGAKSGKYSDEAVGKSVVFVGGTITSGVKGYVNIDHVDTSLLLAVPAYTDVTFQGTTFNNVMRFNYQLYTSPWSQLGELKFDDCTFNGIIVGATAAQTLTFDGCEFTDFTNKTDQNNSNPTWIRPAYGNWSAGDNEGQGDDFRSLTEINFINNTVTSTRPVKFEYISQWDMTSTVTATDNYFDISAQDGDTSTKNVGLYLGAHTDNDEFNLVAENNRKSEATAALYTIPANKTSLPAGSTVKDSKGNEITITDALEWKTENKVELKTEYQDSAVAGINGVGYDSLDAAITAAKTGDTITILKAAEDENGYKLNGSLTYSGKAITIKAASGVDVKFDMSTGAALHGAKITFEGVTFEYKTNNNYIGLQHTDTMVYNNCVFNGQMFLYGASETFNDCTFNQNSADAYNVWTYGAKEVEFNDCTFNCAGKSVLVYNEGSNSGTDLTVTDTTFHASQPVEGKAAIEIDTSLMKGQTKITVDQATADKITGFGVGSNSGSSLWNDKKQTAETNKNTTVVVAGTTVFAPPAVAEVGGEEFTSLTEAFAALNETDHTLTLIDSDAWDATKPVYWQAGDKSGYVAKLTDALTAAYKANASAITIVCRPGADVGTMTHGHVADNLTIYGNNAYLSGGECDLEVDTYKFNRDTGAQANDGAYLDKNITITAYEMDNLGVWGQRNTAHKVTVNLTDCDGKALDDKTNVQRVYISGNTGVNDITLINCDFLTKATAVFSNADGEIVIDSCSFTGGQAPVNFNHKANGKQTVTVKNSTFTNCGDEGEWKQFAAPIRFVNSGSGTSTTTVDNCTFNNTVGSNGDILIGDGRDGKDSNDVTLTVKNTAAIVQAQKPGYYNGGSTDDTKKGSKNVAASDTFTSSIEEMISKGMADYVTVGGIKGFEDKKFASFTDAYEAIKPKLEELCTSDALGQGTATAEKFDTLFTVRDANGNATLTYTIHGTVTYDETNMSNLLTMGRKASHYGNDRHLINFKFVGGSNDKTKDTLTVNSNITLPYEWWGEKTTTSISFEDLTITGSATNGLYTYQPYFEGIDFKVNNCTLRGIKIYNCANVGGSYTITDSTLDGTGEAANAYAIHLQGNETAPLTINISGNTISGYDRGINIDQKTANATISRNMISVKDTNRSCIQLTQLATTTVSGNTLNLTGGNALTFHSQLAESSKINFTGNTVNGTGYLIYDDTENPIELTYSSNTVASTVDTTKGIYNGNTKELTKDVDAVINPAPSYSGGSSSDPTYSVSTPSKTENGTVTVSPKSASKGDTVTITVDPDEGYELDELTVTDANGNEISVRSRGNNQYTFTMPRSRVTIEATFVEIEEEPDLFFVDVPTSAYYYDAVYWAAENGVTYGTSATTFSPDVIVSRAQMVTFLWRAHGSPEPRSSVNPFTDVSSSAYYYDAVLWAVENGVTNGTSATTFSPDATVTRAQAVTFQWRAAGSPAVSGGSFADVADSAYYAGAVSWAVANGVTNGTGGSNFSPDVGVSRAQAVTFLWRQLAA